jgi:hypothetical protein
MCDQCTIPFDEDVREAYVKTVGGDLEAVGKLYDLWLARHEIEVRADQIERDAKVVEAGGRYWDAELVHFRHLYPAEIAIELRWQKSAYIKEEN